MPDADAVHDSAIVVDVAELAVRPVGADGATDAIVTLAIADVLDPTLLLVTIWKSYLVPLVRLDTVVDVADCGPPQLFHPAIPDTRYCT